MALGEVVSSQYAEACAGAKRVPKERMGAEDPGCSRTRLINWMGYNPSEICGLALLIPSI